MAKKNETVADQPVPPEEQGGEIQGTGEANPAATLDELREKIGGLAEHIVPIKLESSDVIVVGSGDRAVEQQVIRLNRAFRAQGIRNLILVAPDATMFEVFDEERMNLAGWYRRDSE